MIWPRASGARAVELWERANGRAERILKLVSPPESFIESFEFENEIETIEPLLFILRRFLQQLATRLNTIYLVAKELRLRITFADKSHYERIFKIPQPTNNEDILFRMLHTHLENFTSKHPIVAIELEAQPSRSVRQQFGLFETALRDPMQLHETLARLVGLLGADRVGTPVLEETHRPDAFRMEPFAWEFGHPEPEIGHPERSRGIPMRNLKGNIAGSLDCARDDGANGAVGDAFHCGVFGNVKRRRCYWKIIGPLMCAPRKSEPDWQWSGTTMSAGRAVSALRKLVGRARLGAGGMGCGNREWRHCALSLRSGRGGRSMGFMIEDRLRALSTSRSSCLAYPHSYRLVIVLVLGVCHVVRRTSR